MNKDDLEKKLENLSKPQLPQTLQHQWQLKLSILSAKKSARASLWLLLIPFLLFISRVFQEILNVSIPPGSWFEIYSIQWPLWLRVTVFITIIIVIPLIAVILNLLSITWIQYDREQKVLHISIRMRTINLIIIIVAGLVALLFIATTITDG
jgi:hypothetical protein